MDNFNYEYIVEECKDDIDRRVIFNYFNNDSGIHIKVELYDLSVHKFEDYDRFLDNLLYDNENDELCFCNSNGEVKLLLDFGTKKIIFRVSNYGASGDGYITFSIDINKGKPILEKFLTRLTMDLEQDK